MEMDFRTLSESLEADELREYFIQFFNEYQDKPKNMESLGQLHALAYRQWDTYEPLDDNIAEKAEEYLMSAVNFSSYEITDIILSIVENLSLKNIFGYIVDSKDKVSDAAIARLISDAQEEYGERINNPYGDFDDIF